MKALAGGQVAIDSNLAGAEALGTGGIVGDSPRPGAGVHPPRRVLPRRLGDVIGVAWVLIAGLAIFVPVFIHGNVLGPFDLLGQISLTKQPGATFHINQNSDLADSLIPWWNLAWQQVHHGHLPLWNPYGGLGMPLAFNWQTAPFSLPALVSYLFPEHWSFTAAAVVNMVVAGMGAYVLGRVMRLGVVASAAVGTIFELSGPFAAWLGYPFPSVLSWAGWIFAFGLLLLRGRHRTGCIVGLAVSVAFSLYGGAPEGFVVLMMATGCFFVVFLACRARWLRGAGPILRPAIDLCVATVAGLALAAPFALPGLQLVAHSVRSTPSGTSALPIHTILYLAFQGYDGLPIYHGGMTVVFGIYGAFYTETAAYVGVAALALGVMAVFLRWHRLEVRAFAVVAVLCLAVIYVPPVHTLATDLPLIGSTIWVRALMPMALALAALAGFGLDLLVRTQNSRRVARGLGVVFSIAALALLSIWIFGQGPLSPAATGVRDHTFIWPAVEIAAGLVAAGFLLFVVRYRTAVAAPVASNGTAGRSGTGFGPTWLRWSGALAAIGLLAVQTAFLVSAGAQMMQSSHQAFPNTPRTRALVNAVGSSTVAFGQGGCARLGLEPNINDAYGVHEFSVYDPIIPKDYFTAWPTDTGTNAGAPLFNEFCPGIFTVAVAREFGVQYVLEVPGTPGPPGSISAGHVGDEDLYRIPGSGQATVAPLVNGKLPADTVAGTPVVVQHQSPSQWHIKTASASPQVLRLHLTAAPGWTATIDGRPLALDTYAGMMLQARIPAGRHTINLQYWPKTLTLGIVLALLSAACLIALLIVSSRRHRRRSALAGTTVGSGGI
jgi:hypothetical protein